MNIQLLCSSTFIQGYQSALKTFSSHNISVKKREGNQGRERVAGGVQSHTESF